MYGGSEKGFREVGNSKGSSSGRIDCSSVGLMLTLDLQPQTSNNGAARLPCNK